jgi:hypothetical protein
MAQFNHERRAAQRFPFQIPVSIRLKDSTVEAVGVTQDVSAKGAFLYTDMAAAEGDSVQFSLTLPAEITFAQSAPVCCHGRITRVVPQEIGPKFGLAVTVERYEFLATKPEKPKPSEAGDGPGQPPSRAAD